ncbi:HAMP domain [Candidatus Methanoperedens nitroreducens]|uniref:histidine kinase n=1 Tax=Candidatus Methanoperedens nitratireducens TaxID=1392998 RepID=A0A062VA38_9EURY|nr:HAMP domain-containing protein [Candidatus Methanoperedens nitroreducens]KCZ72589.1 HAMP domain [Candidatus Methanoperedens nitroreducens]MDJ1423479.1 HAMP domain-containing protein [Candidatus Methanoperedens sp.]
MKIKYKLLISFFVIVAVFLIAGLAINSNIQEMSFIEKEMSKDFSINQQATNYEKGARQVQVGVFLYAHGSKELGGQLIREGYNLMTSSRNNLKNSLKDPAMLSDLSDIERLEEKVIQVSDEVTKTADVSPGNTALIEQNLHTLEGRVEALNLKLSGFIEVTDRAVANSIERSRIHADDTIKTTYYAVIGSMIVSLILAIFLANRLTNPLRSLTDVANKVSRGEIDAKISVASKDEIGELAESFKRMVNAFKIMDALSKQK